MQTVFTFAFAALLLVMSSAARADTFYVATDGDDAADGSSTTPWATIDHALRTGLPAEGGHTVLVRDGTYEGRANLTRSFAAEVVVRAENRYGATLTNVGGGGEVLRVYTDGPARLSVESFVMTNLDPSRTCGASREPFFIVHIQDASMVTLRDNVIFGATAAGTCNELLKINRSSDTGYPRDILVEGNFFFDPANVPGADLIDAVRPGEVDIVGNLFMSRSDRVMSQSFITIKRQAPASATARSPRYRVARNVFMSWGGRNDQAFVQFGEDGVAEIEIDDALVENNLFVGDSSARMSAPIQLKGAANVVIRANTVVGDLPAGAFALRVGTEGSNPEVSDFVLANNVFSDPTGTMEPRLVNPYGMVVRSSIALVNNLYWNAGGAIPTTGEPVPADDTAALMGDPQLADPSGITAPSWDIAGRRFASGEATIADEIARVVLALAPPTGSAVVDAADPTNMPVDDIRGLARDTMPDVGCFEVGADTPPVGTDAGTSDRDGGSPPVDAGTDPPTDAGTVPPGGDDGCGCRVHRGDDRPPWPLAIALALLVVRRRRC